MADEKALITIKLKDFDGKVVREFKAQSPLAFPYLFWGTALFVSSRDDSTVYLQRSYHALMEQHTKEDDGKH
jgi:hypothetical protein